MPNNNNDKQPRPAAMDAWLKEWTRRVAFAGEQALGTVGPEPDAALGLIRSAATDAGMPVFVWDCVGGFTSDPADDGIDLHRPLPGRDAGEIKRVGDLLSDPGLRSPLGALQAIRELDVRGLAACSGLLPAPDPDRRADRAVFIFLNFYEFFEDAAVRQYFQNLVSSNRLSTQADPERDCPVLLPIHFVQVPYGRMGLRGIEAVQQWIRPMPLGLPDEAELRQYQVAALDAAVRDREAETGATGANDHTAEFLAGLAAAAAGLPRYSATTALFYAAAKHGGLRPAVLAEVADQAAAHLASSGTMRLLPPHKAVLPEHLGGVGRAITHLDEAAATFTREAHAQALDPALGCWFCGLPGSGKSALTRAAGVIFQRRTGRPWRTVEVQTPAFYGSLVGETEERWYEFVDRARALGECIFYFDEADKVFGGVEERSGDSGVSRSLFGLWLAWMSDPDRRGYVILAMNDPTGIPDAALRAGRLDAGFFFDMPTPEVRTEIARIHFGKRMAAMAAAAPALRDQLKLAGTAADLKFGEEDWRQLGQQTQHYLPGDIERLVIQARQVAHRTRGVAIPTFAETMAIVAERRRLIEGADESLKAQDVMLDRVKRLRTACRAKGAEPVHAEASPSAPSPRTNGGRGRRGAVGPPAAN